MRECKGDNGAHTFELNITFLEEKKKPEYCELSVHIHTHMDRNIKLSHMRPTPPVVY